MDTPSPAREVLAAELLADALDLARLAERLRDRVLVEVLGPLARAGDDPPAPPPGEPRREVRP